MSTLYSSGLLVGLPLDRALQKHQLSNAYGVLVHPREPTPIASVAVASRAHPDLRDRDLLTVMFCDPVARQLAAASDAQVTAKAIDALAHLDPTLTSVLPRDAGRARVVRHAQAMPTCPPGHAAAVAAYCAARSSDPLILAGDYLGFPWTDSAAATGIWAASAAVSGQQRDINVELGAEVAAGRAGQHFRPPRTAPAFRRVGPPVDLDHGHDHPVNHPML